MFETKTPYDVDTWPIDNVLNLVHDPVGSKLPSKENRLNIIKILYSALGYDLTPDIALCLVDEPMHQLVISTAGSGKTTLSQVKAFIEKLIRPLTYENNRALYGNRMLCLVYNEHNVDQMKNTHIKLASTIMSKVKGFKVDTEISAFTLHGFCSWWKGEYPEEWGFDLKAATALSQFESEELLALAAQTTSKKFIMPKNPPLSSLVSMYQLAKSLMLPYGHEDIRIRFPEIDIEDEALDLLFKFYEILKRKGEKFDFVDQLLFMKNLLEENAAARARIQAHYDYVIADEVQDFTPLMMAVVRLIVGDNKPFLAIGDEDQTLYQFNGADVSNVLNFKQFFPEGEVYFMATNRRCARKIVEASTYLIEKNTLRFNKKILSCREGGVLEPRPYHTDDGMYASIISKLQSMSQDKRNSTVICYRERANSFVLAEKLEENGLKFNILSGHTPFSHELYKHVEQVLAIISNPFDAKQHLNLYKVLPITQTELIQVLGWDYEEQEFKDGRTRIHFRDVDFGRFSTRKAFTDELQVLVELSKDFHEARMRTYFPKVFDMILKYFWTWKMSQRVKEVPMNEVMTERVRHFYNSPLTYESFMSRLDIRRRNLRNQNLSKTGTTLSTMHGLKGLEFDVCMIIHLDDAIFPSLDSTLYMQGKAVEALEAERRLMFVAMTRARDEEYLYYPIRNPSHFISELEEGGFINNTTKNDSGDGPSEMSLFYDQVNVEQKKGNSVSGRLQNIFDNL